MSGLLKQVERTILTYRLLEPGEAAVVAVSGGPDSTALLHLLSALATRHDWRLTAAHVNHGLRGEESDMDEQYVRELCGRLGIPCQVGRVDVSAMLARSGNNVQAAARAVRYEALKKAAATAGANTLILGHHADDQTETVLMRLLRGAGPGGVAGMRLQSSMRGMKLVRPLLRNTRSEIEAYCETEGLRPRLDSSNLSRKYFRNVVRMDILPYLQNYSPRVSESLRRLGEMSADESDFMDAESLRRMKSAVEWGGGRISAPRSLFLGAHIALQRRMIKIILNSLESDGPTFDFMEIERIRQAIATDHPTTTRLQLSKALTFHRMYETLEWTAAADAHVEPYSYTVDLSRPGQFVIGEAGAVMAWRLEPKLSDETPIPRCENPFAATFDAEALGGTVIVRSRRPGDRMTVFGLTGTKKVKDIFIDGKLPARLRSSWPIVADRSGRVIWVPGFRQSREAAPHERSRQIVMIECRGLGKRHQG